MAKVKARKERRRRMMKKTALILMGTLMFLLVLAVPVGAAQAGGLSSETESVLNPTPVPGGSFAVPVMVPGANIVVTFSLDTTGKIASITVTGAPDGANVETSEDAFMRQKRAWRAFAFIMLAGRRLRS